MLDDYLDAGSIAENRKGYLFHVPPHHAATKLIG